MKKVADDNAKLVAGFAKGIDDKTAAAAAAQKARIAKAGQKKKASLAQKNPEDFSADEKEAAQAVINNANAATLANNN